MAELQGDTSRPRHHFQVDIANDFAHVKPVRDLVASLCRLEGFDDETIEEIKLVATELINNSIEHSGSNEATEIRGRVFAASFELSVVDRGEETLDDGIFDFDTPPSHLGDRGRGLFLIKAFTDEARVSQPEGGGTCITIVKHKPVPGEDDDES